MTQLVKIENQSIAVKEYKGLKVVTFKVAIDKRVIG